MSTKMHCALSPEGLLHEDLSAGQVPDAKVFADFSKHWSWTSLQAVVADKGYDSNSIRQIIRDPGKEPVIPYRKSRWNDEKIKNGYDQSLYKTRSYIERFFAHLLLLP